MGNIKKEFENIVVSNKKLRVKVNKFTNKIEDILNANFDLKRLGVNKILVCYFEHVYGFSIYGIDNNWKEVDNTSIRFALENELHIENNFIDPIGKEIEDFIVELLFKDE